MFKPQFPCGEIKAIFLKPLSQIFFNKKEIRNTLKKYTQVIQVDNQEKC
jgi:hypothetical protein